MANKRKKSGRRRSPKAARPNPVVKRGKLGQLYRAKGVRVRKEGRKLVVDLIR